MIYMELSCTIIPPVFLTIVYCELSLRATLDNYSSELNQIVHFLLVIIAKNLGLKPEVLTEKCKDGVQSVRINYYPPCLQYDKVRYHFPFIFC
jgi:isopenicillin N synthase-like dioxygenase